jgi:hypothetical protein
MPKFERFVNNAITTLNGSINASQTTLIVVNASSFPTNGNFRIIIDSELMLVTGVSGTTFTVTRAIESTIGATHASGKDVKAVLTKGALNRSYTEIIGDITDNTPKLGSFTDKNGALLNKASFTEINTAGATFSDFEGGIKCLSNGDSGTSVRMLARALPSTPYTITIAFTQFYYEPTGSDFPQAGIGWRDSGTNELHLCIAHANSSFPFGHEVSTFVDENSFNGSDFAADPFYAATNLRWLQINDDGVNFKFRVGANGVDWFELADVSRTSWLDTPDQYVLFFNPSGANTASEFFLTHWKYLAIS